MSFRRLKDVGFENLEDILHSCPKGISYSGIWDISQRQFLDILAKKYLCKMPFRHLKNVGFAKLEDVLHSYLKKISSSAA